MELLTFFRRLLARRQQRCEKADTAAALMDPKTGPTVLIELVGGPQGGRRRVIDRDEFVYGPHGVEWHGVSGPIYVFDTPPEYVRHGGEFRWCWHGRFVGWE